MIISIRGTSGSGKSTLVRKLMSNSEPITDGRDLLGYRCGNFLVMGSYAEHLTAVGVDYFRFERERVFQIMERLAEAGNLVYEGLLIANEVGRTVKLAQKFETRLIFLTTPLELCLEQVQKRRKVGGSLFGEVADKVNPKKTTEKFRELERVASRFSSQGVPVERLSWDDALVRCQELLKL